jgi:hypothetical protein
MFGGVFFAVTSSIGKHYIPVMENASDHSGDGLRENPSAK